MAAVLFTGKDIANMHLYHRGGNGSNSIVDGDAGVAVASCVEDDAVGGEAYFMEAINDFSLDVALVVADFYVREFLPKAVYHLFHGGMSIDGGLTFACEVQIGAVDNLYSFHLD